MIIICRHRRWWFHISFRNHWIIFIFILKYFKKSSNVILCFSISFTVLNRIDDMVSTLSATATRSSSFVWFADDMSLDTCDDDGGSRYWKSFSISFVSSSNLLNLLKSAEKRNRFYFKIIVKIFTFLSPLKCIWYMVRWWKSTLFFSINWMNIRSF